MKYDPKTLRFAIMEGSEGRVGSTLQRFILWCHVYDPESGSYQLFAYRMMQLGGFATIFLMVVGLGFLWLRDPTGTSNSTIGEQSTPTESDRPEST